MDAWLEQPFPFLSNRFPFKNMLFKEMSDADLRGTAVAGPANLTFPWNIDGLPLSRGPLPAVFPSIAILAAPMDCRLFITAGLSHPSVCRLLLVLILLCSAQNNKL